MSVNDLWHKTDARTGEPVCREHGKVPTKQHGRGKRWEVRKGAYRKAFAKRSDALKEDKKISDEEAHEQALREKEPTILAKDFAYLWLKGYKGEVNSRKQVEGIINNWFVPAVGERGLRELAEDFMFWRAWAAEVEARTSSCHTASQIYYVARGIFREALLDSKADHNPFERVKPPRMDTKKIVPWTSEMVRQMREELPPSLKAIMYLGTVAGLRPGEIAGFSIEDIDDNGFIWVKRQVQNEDHMPVFKPPKYNATRKIAVPEKLIKLLYEHIDLWGIHPTTLLNKQRKAETHPLLFVSPQKGCPLTTGNFSNIWVAARRRVGIPDGRNNGPHAMRHYCASVALANGASLKDLQMLLGHQKLTTTAKYYIHLTEGHEGRIRRAMDTLF